MDDQIPALQGLSFPEAEEQAASGFTVDNIKIIYDNLMVGMTLKDCATLVHLPAQTLNKWWKNNYHGFGEIVDEAYTLNKRHYISKIFEAKDKTQVQASQWMLERKHKEEYTKETVININHQVVDTVAAINFEILAKYITDPEILEIAKDELVSKLQLAKPVVQDIALETTTHEEV